MFQAVLVGAQASAEPLQRAMVRAGLEVVAVPHGAPHEGRRALRGLSPVLLAVALDDSALEARAWVQAGAEQDCPVLLAGDSAAQAHCSELVARGGALFTCQPLDEDYLAELFRDLRHEAEARSRQMSAVAAVAIDQFGDLYGSSPPMRAMYRFLRKAAASDAVLCVHGESGTGKELVAESVHTYSARSAQPFEAINCAAIPAELVESELFGHEKGSFSGAVSAHAGVFERVGRGTLLLDEITEMPQGMQVKLLRVLESGRFRRVGGETDHACDARIIAATNRDPLEAVREGKLREDLYYRISQLEVRVPPLRERGADIVDLARMFVTAFNAENDRSLALAEDAERSLLQYGWPGNVRQLWNVIQKACTSARDRIHAQSLALEEVAGRRDGAGDVVTLQLNRPLREAEERLILASLHSNDGDKQLTADKLGISLRTLYSRLAGYRQ